MSSAPSYANDRTLHGAPTPEGFSLLTWNVLADYLAESGGFLHAPAEALRWGTRGAQLIAQVLDGEGRGATPDVVCLQEVDRFAELEAPLHAAGYSGAWVGKAAGRDGCCVFYRRERFALRWVRPLRYLDAEGRNATQVALLLALLDRRRGDAPLLVVTTHLKAKVGNEAVREAQAQQLRAACSTAAAELDPSAGVVVCGDFNDVPGSSAYRAIRGDGELESAYVRCAGAEAEWTTWKVRAAGEVRRTIDYVFSNAALRPTAVLLPPPQGAIEAERLPGWRYPSDHLSLLVHFEPLV